MAAEFEPQCKVYSKSVAVIFCGEFLSFCEKEFLKINSVTNSLFKKSSKKKENGKILHNCLQYEKIRNILYFQILNIVKFG